MLIDNEKIAITEYEKEFEFIRSCMDLNELQQQKQDLTKEQEQPDFYSNLKAVKENGQKLKAINDKLEKITDLEKVFSDLNTLTEILEENEDNGLYEELKNGVLNLKVKLKALKLDTILTGKYDYNNAILTLHAGAGGTEAQDWANMLFRMYTMWCEKQGYKISVLDCIDGDEAGIKSITFLVSGANAYGYLKAEKGVHRLVRISPFDANARRHTSFASLEVMPELEDLPEIEIRADDLKVDTYRASGAGGQHINKTDSAVRITHLPTGIVVACQNERSQIQNRETAMRMLYGKLAQLQEQKEKEHLAEIRGEIKKIEWGSQIRSYVFQPYTLVKDHRTGFEDSDINSVMNGDITDFIVDYLIKTN